MNTDLQLPAVSRISFWLVPSRHDRRLLTGLINRLADRYGAPRFMPHITLHSTQIAENESPLQVLESATKGMSPFKLELLDVDHGPDRFKSIYIRLDCNPVAPLTAALRASCRHPGSYQFDGHLSLLYLQLPAKERVKISLSLQLPQGPLCFDSVIAITPGPGQNTFDDVRQWRIVAQVGLMGADNEQGC